MSGASRSSNGAVPARPRVRDLIPTAGLDPEVAFVADGIQAQYPDAADPGHDHWTAYVLDRLEHP